MLFRAKKYCEKTCNQALTLSILSCLLSAAALFVSLRGSPGTSGVSPTALVAAEQSGGASSGQLLTNPAPAAQPSPGAGSAVSGKQAGQGTCTAAARGISSFACPGTPTEDVCGVPPYLTCYSGPNEACPPGKVWDPACSCTCIER